MGLQTCYKIVPTRLIQHDITILLQPCIVNLVTNLLQEQPCNKSDIFVKFVDNLVQAVRTHLVDGLSADLLQVVRFLRV